MSFLSLKTWLMLFISSSLALFYIAIASNYMHRESDNIGMVVVPLFGGFLVLVVLALIDFKSIVNQFSFRLTDVLKLSVLLGSVLYAVLGIFVTLFFIIVYLIPYELLKQIGFEYSSITMILWLLFLLQVVVQSYLIFQKISPEELLKPIPSHSLMTEFFGLKKFFIAALILSLLFSVRLYDPSRHLAQGLDPISFYLSFLLQGSLLIYLSSTFGLVVKFLYQKYKKVEYQVSWFTLVKYCLARIVYIVLPFAALTLHTLLIN